ncbi:alpha/beta hydrolase [Rhodococcus sovatensis]|uniref:Alpha/beta hydrolase n=1 Tax=Rhodococcus sovatensis TaxID=1805840 RepID=A0ABZ2PI24_9NOCA
MTETPEPDLAAVFEVIRGSDGGSRDLSAMRADYADYIDYFRDPAPDFDGVITDEVLPATCEVAVRQYLPSVESDPGLVLVYFHGGGWVTGSPEGTDRFTRAVASQLRLHVVSVDYRLAPEHPFPAALDDCLSVVEYLQNLSHRIVVAGDSAGGNLAAAVSQVRVDAGCPVDAQALIYPALAAPDQDRPGPGPLDGYGLDLSEMHYFWNSYAGTHSVDRRLAPLLSEDLRSAPPTLVTTAGFDPLCSEGEKYAQRLIESGVRTHYLPFPRLTHGWIDFADRIPSAYEARDAVIAEIGTLVAAVSMPVGST